MLGDLHDEYYVRIFRRHDAGSDDYHDFLRFVFKRYLEPELKTDSARVAVEKWLKVRQDFYPIARYIREQEHLVRTENGHRTYHYVGYVASDIADAQPILAQMLDILNQLFTETQIAAVLEDYFAIIISGMAVNDLPSEDTDELRKCGSEDPRGELATSVLLLKSRRRQILESDAGRSFGQRARDLLASIERTHEQFRPRDVPPPLPSSQVTPASESGRRVRRIYKGLGQIVSGMALFGANLVSPIAAVSGAMHGAPVLDSAALATGTVTSLGAGIGLVLSGKGDLDGE